MAFTLDSMVLENSNFAGVDATISASDFSNVSQVEVSFQKSTEGNFNGEEENMSQTLTLDGSNTSGTVRLTPIYAGQTNYVKAVAEEV